MKTHFFFVGGEGMHLEPAAMERDKALPQRFSIVQPQMSAARELVISKDKIQINVNNVSIS